MELLNIDALKPGRVLARAVTNDAGAVLCPSGLTLTEALIERLKNAGIEDVVVEGGEEKGPDPAQRIEELNLRFEGVDDPIMLQLKAVMENRLATMQAEREKASQA